MSGYFQREAERHEYEQDAVGADLAELDRLTGAMRDLADELDAQADSVRGSGTSGPVRIFYAGGLNDAAIKIRKALDGQ